MAEQLYCPRCQSAENTRSGVVNGRQRYRCKNCQYHYTVGKLGKRVDDHYVVKALQLYIEGLSYREIERLLGVSHVSVMNWVKQHHLKRPSQREYHPTYKILTHSELQQHLQKMENLRGMGMIITEIGDKFMLIKWERFRK